VKVISSVDPRLALDGRSRAVSVVEGDTGNAAVVASRASNRRKANRMACEILFIAKMKETDAGFDILIELRMAGEDFDDPEI